MGGRGASSSTAVNRTTKDTLPKRWAAAKSALESAPAGFTSRITYEDASGSTLEFMGQVHTAEGKFAGEFGATITRGPGGMTAKLDNLLMESAFQGKGVGAAVASNMDTAFRRMGVSEVQLHAAQVGRYVWARAGYNWDATTGRHMAAEYGKWLAKNGHDAGEASVALKGAGALAATKNGKAFLLSDAPNWYGSKRLS